MKKTRVAVWATVMTTLGVIAYDAYALSHPEKCDTISKTVTKESERNLLIPFLCGMLAGHFFWSQRLGKENPDA